ncbi:glycosyltransferase family 4 protein [Halorientalis litorea]|uniref:glycosyltransferase family 4 protein n=1 Tax=Halorientalis litorea TaxID=2931977 RepID=UPI001FF3F213|nr:glycosyltransferase family 4 protein [Halorientalis litorea]
MKVLMGPQNFAGQPIKLVNSLEERGIEADLVQYGDTDFGYEADKVVDISGDRAKAQIETAKDVVEEDYDIVHLWHRPLFMGEGYDQLAGFDLPLLKSRDIRILYRFTGQDLRLESVQKDINPYNVYRYGYESNYDEERQREYLEFLEHYVDQFIVQDREMHGYRPDATIIPRAMDPDEWDPVGIDESKETPLVVHPPSNKDVKGSWFVQEAVDTLREEGLDFEYEEISGLPHEEAVEKYKQADVIVDQLLIGWHGVVTLEAMALGKPAVCYIRDDLNSDDVPVAEANPETLTDTLRELIRDPDKRARLGRDGREYVEENHDIETVTDQLVDLYEEVLEREPTGNMKPEATSDFDYLHSQYEDQRNKKFKLRYQMKKREELEEELQELQNKAEEYEELKEEVEDLRYKVQRYEELLE